MSKPKPKTLIEEIEEFLGRPDVELSETAFGIAAMNDGKFVGELRAGRRIWPETQDKVRAYIAAELARLRDAA